MVKFIWGTSIVIQESMDAFDTFLREFKIKYRLAYDRRLGVRSSTLRTDQDGETLTYVNYLRLMRQTGECNLNLDTVNLLAYPPTKKLYHQLCNYPQEMVPVMDQVLKDCMLKVAEADMDDGRDDMQGELGDEELRAIGSGLYKVRPFGAEKEVNMRDLNPGGASLRSRPVRCCGRRRTRGADARCSPPSPPPRTRCSPPALADTDKLICIKGLVIRATPIIPDMKTGASASRRPRSVGLARAAPADPPPPLLPPPQPSSAASFARIRCRSTSSAARLPSPTSARATSASPRAR